MRMNDLANSFAIRPATLADVPTILGLIRDLAEYERAPNDVVATEEGLREVLFGEKPSAEVLLGDGRRECCRLRCLLPQFLDLARPARTLSRRFFVRPDSRGKGYGRALLVHLAKIARDRDCGRMEWAVLDWNEPAIKFYRTLGAAPNDEWTIFRLTSDKIAAARELCFGITSDDDQDRGLRFPERHADWRAR